ncbi:hypothetical protein GCM10010472_39740 [Pseudonocardia halophobica]|uniref:PE domain-containing protein n=1 Tax=Pseudonocardia halophobica TaxID=29401 RepID=A0A9W6L9I5_9PSEU|nr:hypothetical protein GCM10017577_54170 [Pseudonocardia halophobica]
MTAPRWDDPGPVVPRSPQSLSYSPVLRVDPERVEGLVGRLEGVIRELAMTEVRLASFMFVAAPGNDEVSRNAARQAVSMFEGARSYLGEWRRQLIEAKEALESQMAGYVSADSRSA